MRDAPSISVLVPVWNGVADGGGRLRAAFGSLFAQCGTEQAPLPSLEILAVDDGSDDGTPAVLDELARADSRLRIVRVPHGGIARALNAGLDAARGDLIARMDADDVAHPQRLARQAAHLRQQPELDVSASRVRFGGDARTAYGFAHYVDWQNSLCSHEEMARNRFRDTPVCHPSAMFRRSAAVRFGGYADGDFAEDWELWLRWFHAGARMEKLPEELLVWNDPPGRLTRTDARYADAANDALRARGLTPGSQGQPVLRRACVSHRIRVLTDTVRLSCAVHGAAHGGRLPSHRSNPQAAGLSRYKTAVRSPATSTAGSSSSAQKTGGHRPPLRSRFFGSRHCRAPSHTQARQIFSVTRTAALIWTSPQKPAPHDSLGHCCSQQKKELPRQPRRARPPHLPPKPHGVIPPRNPS